MKNISISLKQSHLLSPEDTRKELANIRVLFFTHWAMFDKILIANDDFINRIRRDEVNTYFHELNGHLMTQEKADNISESFGAHFRQEVINSKKNWEVQFEKSQNYLRITHLAQTYLYWEESIREKLLALVDFSHPEITILKTEATIRANTFGDLAKIRNSFWHSRSGEIGVCNFKKGQFKELTEFMELEKGRRMVLAASELPKIGYHIDKRLFEFPIGYTLGEDTKHKATQSKCSAKSVWKNVWRW